MRYNKKHIDFKDGVGIPVFNKSGWYDVCYYMVQVEKQIIAADESFSFEFCDYKVTVYKNTLVKIDRDWEFKNGGLLVEFCHAHLHNVNRAILNFPEVKFEKLPLDK